MSSLPDKSDSSGHDILCTESLLTNSYNDQIGLIEKSLAAAAAGDDTSINQRNQADEKLNNKPWCQTKKPSVKMYRSKQQVFSNRSWIYRYNAATDDEALGPKISDQVPAHPPAEFHCDLSADHDIEPNSRSNMLMSWYMAGYHTGYYDAMRKQGHILE